MTSPWIGAPRRAGVRARRAVLGMRAFTGAHVSARTARIETCDSARHRVRNGAVRRRPGARSALGTGLRLRRHDARSQRTTGASGCTACGAEAPRQRRARQRVMTRRRPRRARTRRMLRRVHGDAARASARDRPGRPCSPHGSTGPGRRRDARHSRMVVIGVGAAGKARDEVVVGNCEVAVTPRPPSFPYSAARAFAEWSLRPVTSYTPPS